MTPPAGPTNQRGWIAFAALSGAVSVIAGAFSAHGLDPVAEAKPIEYLHTGSLYEAMHALALLAVVALAAHGGLHDRLAAVARWAFMAGSILFPGALYVMALHGPVWLGAVAPVGGTAFIAGWMAFALAGWIGKSSSRVDPSSSS
jgi:uncharacterized membrane protein YgdD (TMEM256/DUF423 family)